MVARLIIGKFPKEILLKKYGYYEYFNDLIQAIKQGNFAAYNAILNRQQDWFINTGIYMILKKQLESLMFRNLFMRVYVT